MICRQCGRELGDVARQTKFCDECKKERARQRLKNLRERYSENVIKQRARNRKHYASHTEETRARANERNRKKRLLSKLDAAYKNKHLKPFCMWCGKYFKPKYKGEKYCSEECYSHSPFRILCQSNPRVLKYFQRLIERD